MLPARFTVDVRQHLEHFWSRYLRKDDIFLEAVPRFPRNIPGIERLFYEKRLNKPRFYETQIEFRRIRGNVIGKIRFLENKS